MTNRTVAPFGAWASPITADSIVGGTISLGGCALDGDAALWTEGRPAEGGRTVVVRLDPDGAPADVTPAPFNARSRVHEYGGGAVLAAGGDVFFVNFADQRLYRQTPGTPPAALTPEDDARYADMVLDAARDRLICVRENHAAEGLPVNDLVAVPLAGGAPQVLAQGRDFYAAPRLSPDGRQLAWLTWDLPAMPWDTTTLWRATLADDGGLDDAVAVAGGLAESVFQPAWAPDGTLHFVSDRSGWWNLYRATDDGESLCPMEAEFGLPLWQLGMRTYGFAGDGRLVAMCERDGLWSLGLVQDGRFDAFDLPYTAFGALTVAGDTALFVGAAATVPPEVVRFDLGSGGTEVLKRSSGATVDAAFLSVPEPVTFPTEDDAVAHGFFYAPANGDFSGPPEALPPLMVRSHGGPTGATSSAFSLAIQYWTSRGFAVLDVNYRGSTGYGRAYREVLYGVWGLADVADCVAGAEFLAAQGRVDGERLAIRGGSAGGYTTLAALTFHHAFKAGASLYGIGDLEALAADTHKFESRYLDQLIGPYPARRDLYVARSPIHHAQRLDCPVIFFQGLDDKVVPPNQAEAMVASLTERGVPVAYVPFVGEGHGFRVAANIKRALEAELYFYGRVFGFDPADDIEPVEIANLGG